VMVALNWDDLYPPAGGGVWYYHDTTNHRFIVEYDSVRYYSGSIYDKFELVIYDTTVRTPTGDNMLVAQYLRAQGFSSSTVGLQDPSYTIGIQCLYNGSYHRGCAPMGDGRAIKYVTGNPLVGITEGEHAGLRSVGLRLAVVPNPFRNRALVRFSLPAETGVKLAVYDRGGRVVRELIRSRLKPGGYSLSWDGRDGQGRSVAQGVYFLRLAVGSQRLETKVVLLR